MFSRSFRLFEIFGFQIKVDPSWLLIAALIVWSLSTGYFPARIEGLGHIDYLALSIVAMLGMFGCLILHELAHSLVARRFGLGIGGITLFLFGGVAELEEEPVSAKSELWIALAGPAMSFALAGLALLTLRVAEAASLSPALREVIGYLAFINTVLAVFNLLPAFPLDGGRVLRALLWWRNNDVVKATRIAADVARIFAFALIALGVLALFSGQSVGALWQILIGLFLLSAAGNTYRQVLIRAALKGKTVTALMTATPLTVGPSSTVAQLVDTVMLPNAFSFVPVIEGEHLLGYVDAAMLKAIDRENWADTQVGDIFEPVGPANAVPPDMATEALVRRISETGRRKFLITEKGRLLGVISLSDLMAYLDLLQDIGLPGGTARRTA